MSLVLFLMAVDIVWAKWDESLFDHLYRHVDKATTILDNDIIEFSEIEDLVFHKNPTMRNAWLVFKANKDVNDTSDTYYDQADALEFVTGDDATDASNAAKAQGLRIMGDNNADDSYTNYLNNVMQEKNIILDTKLAFINYHRSVIALQKAEKTIQEASRQLDSGKINYEMGTLTKTELLKLENAYKEAEADLILQKSNVLTYKRTVLINCGYNMLDDIQLGNIVHVTSEQVDSHNDFYDKKTAIENNIQYQIYQKKVENSRSESAKVNNQTNLENAVNAISNDIDKKYHDMHDGMVALYTSALNYEYAKDNTVKATSSYEQGAISRKDYNTIVYNEEVARIDGELKYFDLDILYETYIAAVDGIASAG